MKAVMWNPLLKKEEIKDTIWEKIDDEQIKLDIDELEMMFG